MELQLELGIYCSNLGEIPSVLSFPIPLLVHQKPHVTDFMHLLRTWANVPYALSRSFLFLSFLPVRLESQ